MAQGSAGLLGANDASGAVQGRQAGSWAASMGTLIIPLRDVGHPQLWSPNSTEMQGEWRAPKGMMRTHLVKKDRRGLVFSPWGREGSQFSSIYGGGGRLSQYTLERTGTTGTRCLEGGFISI